MVKRRRISTKGIVILIVDLSSKGLDKEDLERLLQHHLKIASVSLKFSSIYLAYFLLVCVYMYLSMLVLIFIDRSILSNLPEWEIHVFLLSSIAGIVLNLRIGAAWKNFESEVHHTITPSLFFDG